MAARFRKQLFYFFPYLQNDKKSCPLSKYGPFLDHFVEKIPNEISSPLLGCANKDLWALCAPIFIIVVYCKAATSYFLGYGITGTIPLQFYNNRNRCTNRSLFAQPNPH